jgi:hypothetical protein
LQLGLLLLCHQAAAIKLRFRYEECLYHEFNMYEPFYGSYVALSDVYGMQASYTLLITAPSGTRVHEAVGTEV